MSISNHAKCNTLNQAHLDTDGPLHQHIYYNVLVISPDVKHWLHGSCHASGSYEVTLTIHVNIILQGNVVYNVHTPVTANLATRLTNPRPHLPRLTN